VTTYQLNPELDLASLAQDYAANRRVRVHNLLAQESVIELYDFLDQNEGWWQLINMPTGIIELGRSGLR
jgi:hypothetical protein